MKNKYEIMLVLILSLFLVSIAIITHEQKNHRQEIQEQFQHFNARLEIHNKHYKSLEEFIQQLHTYEALFYKGLYSGINPKQLFNAIEHILKQHNVYSKNMQVLLFYTIAIESKNGRYIQQLAGGKARGIYQIEPATEQTIIRSMHNNKVFYNIRQRAENTNSCLYDIEYQTILAYWNYYRRLEHANFAINHDEIFQIYKKYWNTHLGKTTKEFANARIKELNIEGLLWN